MEKQQQEFMNNAKILLETAQKNILTTQETAAYTGIAISTLYKMTSNRDIPHYKPSGKLLYFKREEVDTWLLRNRVCSKEEITSQAILATCMPPVYRNSNEKLVG